MPTGDLTKNEGVQAYLQSHPTFAARSVEKLSGGYCNFTYRIRLIRTLAGRETLVLKYAAPYHATFGSSDPFDQKRQVIEARALHLAGQLSKCSSVHTFVAAPAVHFFDEENHVIIMEDAGVDSQTLKQVLIEDGLSKNVSAQIGSALGEFIGSVHSWNRNPNVDLSLFADDQNKKEITRCSTYGLLESTLSGKDNISELSDPPLVIPEAKMKTIAKLVEKRRKAIVAASDPVTHGDLWLGNLIISIRRGTNGMIEGVEKLYVLDWELAKIGLPGLDVGRFCGELYTLSQFYPAREESTRTMLGSFLDAYRERRGMAGNVDLVRTALSHAGAQVVVWAPRSGTWFGRQKTREVVEKGAEMLVLGEEGSELSLKTSIMGPLF